MGEPPPRRGARAATANAGASAAEGRAGHGEQVHGAQAAAVGDFSFFLTFLK